MRSTTGSGAESRWSLKFALRKPSPSGSLASTWQPGNAAWTIRSSRGAGRLRRGLARIPRACSGAPGTMLPACAHTRQPLCEARRKAGLHFGRDESGFVEIVEMRLVLCAKAGELHVDQVRQRDQAKLSDSPVGAEFRRCLRIQMDGPTSGGLVRPNQHVDSRHVAMLETKCCGSFRDLLQIGAAYNDIDVLREPPGIRLRFLDVQVHRETSGYPILKSCRREEPLRESRQIE